MDAMDYEFLLRRVYHCGRSGVKGADADVYRKLEHAEMHLNDPYWNKTQEQKEYDYRSSFAEVKMHVRNALVEGLKQIHYKATKQDVEKIEAMETQINSIRFYDKKRLDEVIDEADEIFRKYGLEPR